VKKQAVDSATLKIDQISRQLPFHVRLFDVTQADLGNPKHRDTAEMLARTAPHLLAVDIVNSLRQAGFNNVILDEVSESESESVLILTGRFTQLNPGSQAARAWIGFGAGRSKVCIDGNISNEAGMELGSFVHCRKGLGWGESGNQMEQSTVRVGDSVAQFLTAWADGHYAR